jgi:multiple sugar transport system ATP-binding protein
MASESIQTTADDAPESGSGSYISISDMRKTFNDGEIVACEEIDLSISQDEFVVLLGPSGCGKTTTLRCISGLEIPDQGEVLLDGEEITTKKPKKRDLAFVFQNISLFPHMSVRKNIRFGLDMKTGLTDDEKQERVEETAEMLDIGELLDRKPSALSGGQQQRVSLGRAMVMEPKAFLLDEPFSALDAKLRDQMRVEVKKLQRRLNRAMVFVTHDQEEAMTLGDKIVVMNDGQIFQIGTPYQIYNEPANRFVAGFIGSPPPNFFDCEIDRSGGAVTLQFSQFTLELSPEQADRLDDGVESAELGIRSEYLRLDGSDGLFRTEIDVIEPHGENDVIHMRSDDLEITATADQNTVDADESPIHIDFDTDKIWLFDESGDRIL